MLSPVAIQPREETPFRDEGIQFLKESALSLSCSTFVSTFVTTSSGVTFMATALAVQTVASFILHGISACFKGRSEVIDWLKSINFAIFTSYNLQNFVHESGHALAAQALYQNPRPTIRLTPFGGGLTQFYKTKLSWIGRKIGPSASTCLVIASGPAITLLISAAIFAVGLSLRHKRSFLSKFLIASSLVDFFHHAEYALSALKADRWVLAHDFVHLSVFGYHPIAMAVAIAAIPVIISFGVVLFERNEPLKSTSSGDDIDLELTHSSDSQAMQVEIPVRV